MSAENSVRILFHLALGSVGSGCVALSFGLSLLAILSRKFQLKFLTHDLSTTLGNRVICLVTFQTFRLAPTCVDLALDACLFLPCEHGEGIG